MQKNHKETKDEGSIIEPSIIPLVAGCKANYIGRNKAFELAKAGLIETFKVGSKTYTTPESLRTLPARLAAAQKVTA